MGASIVIAAVGKLPEDMRILDVKIDASLAASKAKYCRHKYSARNQHGVLCCVDCYTDLTPKLDKSHVGYTVLVPCDKVPGHNHYQAVGVGDPKEMACGHTFKRQFPSDGLVCSNPECGLTLSGEMLDALGPDRYDRERNRLADECGKLKSENDELLRENAMLRRRVEKLQRK